MIREVELVRNKGDIVEHYRVQFKLRYGGYPMDLSRADVAALEKLVDQAKDFKMLKQVVAHFFEESGDNDWYLKQAHDVACMVTNLKKVYAHLLRTTKAEPRPLLIVTNYHCDFEDCGARTQITVMTDKLADHANRFFICPQCERRSEAASAKIVSEAYVNAKQKRAIEATGKRQPSQ